MSSLLSGSRARLAPERHHRDRPFLRDARHEVVDPGFAPEFDLARVEAAQRAGGRRARACDPRSGASPTSDARVSARRRVGEAGVRDRDEVAVALADDRREHQRHAIDEQRLGDAVTRRSLRRMQVEIAVEVAGEADERAAIVVAIAVVDAIERRWMAFFTGRDSSTTTSVASSAMTGCAGRRPSGTAAPASLQQDRVDRGDRRRPPPRRPARA